MKTSVQVCLAAVALAACSGIAGSSVYGTWEGELGGVKAVTLTVRDVHGKPAGDVVFYVIDKKFTDPDKRIVGRDKRPLVNPTWDGKTLRFRAADKAFAVTLSGEGKAILDRLRDDGKPDLSVAVSRVTAP